MGGKKIEGETDFNRREQRERRKGDKVGWTLFEREESLSQEAALNTRLGWRWGCLTGILAEKWVQKNGKECSGGGPRFREGKRRRRSVNDSVVERAGLML